MFLNFHRTSIGQFAIMATVKGSYGETVHTQVGRNYQKVEMAAKAAIRMAANPGKYTQVTLKNLNTKQLVYIGAQAAQAYLKNATKKTTKH